MSSHKSHKREREEREKGRERKRKRRERKRKRREKGWRVRSECDARRSLTLSGAIRRAEHDLQWPHHPTPRGMAAAQVVRQPIRRVVSFGSLTVGGCLTLERPVDPCPHPRQRGGAVQSGLGCTRTKTLGGIPRTAPHATGVRYRRWTLGSPPDHAAPARRSSGW